MYQNYGYIPQYQGFQNNPYMNSFQNNYQQLPSNEILQGKYVDSIDVVKAQNVDLNGNMSWYPKADKSEIYCKGLNPNTGSSYILTYKLVENNEMKPVDNNQIYSTISDLKNEMNELKNLILENLTAPSVKGGDK